ncbi:MAG: tryptophan--tRNA ligase [Thermoflavifilum sp.]|nr:tryptophan--tRNA ligase [Thermoflavifilum sp.]
MQTREIVVSGIRPTGFLHLGNYFGAIRQYLHMQQTYECYFFVADYHSLTTHQNPHELRNHVYRVLAEYLACGLDPEQATIYVQSDMPEKAELYLLLNMLAYKGELEKVPTFKEKIRGKKEGINAGLLTYPVLMAADILIHRATKVPVGKDQEPHLEMARNLASRFNQKFGFLFPEPTAYSETGTLLKVPSLDGKGKMSKSENEMATIYLADSDDIIRKKLARAKTDAGPQTPHSPKSPEIENLFLLLKLVSAPETLAYFEQAYDNCTIRYGELKQQLADDIISLIAPIRERAAALQKDIHTLQKIRKQGAEKACASARQTLLQARALMGIQYD